MSILLWALQAVVALFCISGSAWRFFNYEQAAKDVPSMAALPYSVWNLIGAFEIICALALILPGLFNIKPQLTPIAAAALAIEMLLVSALHVKYFGFQMQASNPAMWSISLCLISAFIAYGRFAQ